MTMFVVPTAPKRNRLQKAYFILKYAHDTAESLLRTFEFVRRARAAKGAPTDEEQDLLRAMLVFAGAGLDSMIKQIIRDALPGIMEFNEGARDALQKFVARRLQRSEGEDNAASESTLNMKVLASVLMAESPRSALIELLIKDLTAGSLQSTEELFRILPYLGLQPNAVGVSRADLKSVFDCRNLLIHELDIDFAQPNRNRFPRRRKDMVEYAGRLLTVSAEILKAVDEKLTEARAAQT